MSDSNPHNASLTEDVPDIRIYLAQAEGWSAHVKHTWEKEYCFQKEPGDDYFHLIMHGEVYLQHDDEKYCLKCALRRGTITHDRLGWQKRSNPS